MTEENWGRITVYNPSMAAKAAEMFNAFNEIWPGGFGGGIPYNEQRVKDWLDKSSAIADLIALDTEGNPVGYCGLYPHFRDFNAAFIGILGVHPEVLGKKFGKRLLLKALEIAAEKGIYRVDLHTWAGNLKAVPLYKKVGLFWVPDTSAYMQDYIPGLFQIPLVAEWFAKHPDWYNCFKRELSQAPDKTVVDGMEVYIYTFEADGDRLSAHIDRYGWGVSGIERVLDGERLSIQTTLLSHEILIGVPNALTIEVFNSTGEDMTLGLQVEPFEGLTWTDSFPPFVVIKNGEKSEITREFVVDSSATLFKSNEIASEVIKSVITLEDSSLELWTGGKIRPAVTIMSQDMYKLAPPGAETVVYLDVMNNTDRELTGKVDITLEGATKNENKRQLDITLSPREVSGIEIPVFVPDHPDPVITVCAVPSVKIDEKTFAMPSYEYSVVADIKDLALVVEGAEKEKFTVLTDFLKVVIEREWGRIRIGSRVPGMDGENIDFEVGPPFGFSLDRTLKFDYETKTDGRYFTVVLTGKSIHVPGIQIQKYIRVAPGMHEVEFLVVLTNFSYRPLHVAGRTLTGFGEGLHISPFEAVRSVFTPFGGKIVESDPSTSIMNETMVPQEPEHWEESWTAAQNLNKSDFLGWIWNPEHVEKVKVFNGLLHTLESKTKVLAPGKLYEPVHLWYTFSHASLQEVRNRWNQLVGGKEIPSEQLYGLSTVPLVKVECADTNVIEKGKKSKKTLEISFATPYPFPGELSLVLPPGWEGQFLAPEKGETIAMPDAVPGTPVLVEIELSVPSTTAASELVELHFCGEFELDFDVPFLVMGEHEVIIKEEKRDGRSLMEVSNGALTFKVVTDLGGNLIQLKDSEGRSFFADNFPEVKPKFFTGYNIGGIQPYIFVRDEDNPFFEPEKTHAEVVEEGLWKGVRVSWTIKNQELLRGCCAN